MIFVYNFLQILLLITFLPLLVVIIVGKKKYHGRFLKRLGISLPDIHGTSSTSEQNVFWVHALSVGEVTSALPLVKGLRDELPDAIIIFSVTTSTGHEIAVKQFTPYVDRIIPAPVDLFCTINRFIKRIRPDIFILIETDFWPNWLYCLRKSNIPMLLANGRISKQSFARYQKFRYLFLPLFRSFNLLSVQTENDALQLIKLGVSEKSIAPLGNLKYGTSVHRNTRNQIRKKDLGLPDDSVIWICGSTHKGEEEILLNAFADLKKDYEQLILIIAPRDPGRGPEILELVSKFNFKVSRRTMMDVQSPTVLILDTIGELSGCYHLAEIAFIGGSLVPCGGHNPLEAAAQGVPVLFGPYMEDFLEIAKECIHYSSAVEVQSADDICKILRQVLSDESRQRQMSQAALKMIKDNADVVTGHIEAVKNLLTGTKNP